MMPSTQSPIAIAEVVEPVPERAASFWRDAMRRYRRNRLAVAGLIVVLAIIVLAAGANITEAGLGFLGLGIDPTTPDWGNMIATARENISYYWHLALFPALALSVTMLAFNFVGDGLRDALDPRDKR